MNEDYGPGCLERFCMFLPGFMRCIRTRGPQYDAFQDDHGIDEVKLSPETRSVLGSLAYDRVAPGADHAGNVSASATAEAIRSRQREDALAVKHEQQAAVDLAELRKQVSSRLQDTLHAAAEKQQSLEDELRQLGESARKQKFDLFNDGARGE